MAQAEVELTVYPDECDAFGHLKVLGYSAGASALLAKAGVGLDEDRGLVKVEKSASGAR